MNSSKRADILAYFEKAEAFCKKYYPDEIRWSNNRPPFIDLTAQDFLREYAWVVLCSGFRYKVIELKWRDIRTSFFWFEPELIWKNHDKARTMALNVFRNRKKISAILSMAGQLAQGGYTHIRNIIQQSNARKRLEYLKSFPFIGDVTKYHLARNLGFDYMKPDRHIVKIAERFGVSPFELGHIIHDSTGIRLGTIDVILWRFMEQKEGKTDFDERPLTEFLG